jgi:drug/metabolite transporter (DMT)-like permease
MLSPTAAVLFSETVLSLYPILIKSVPTNLTTQTLARFLIYPLAALLVGGIKPLLDAYKGGAATLFENLGYGSVNLLHIGSSYLAFKELPTGIAMSLFYTYPLWNIIASSLFLGEQFPWQSLPVLLIALIGASLVATTKSLNGEKALSKVGIAAALVAALSETAIFLTVKKTAAENPFHNIHQIYLAGIPLLIALIAFKGGSGGIDWNWHHWVPLVAFNGLLGFVGYSLRFWSIPKLNTLIYSVLSLFGIVASFMWGKVMLGENVAAQALVGGALIGGAIGYLRLGGSK